MVVTVSIGGAAGEGDRDLLAEADAQLYLAKQAGRDRVAISHPTA